MLLHEYYSLLYFFRFDYEEFVSGFLLWLC